MRQLYWERNGVNGVNRYYMGEMGEVAGRLCGKQLCVGDLVRIKRRGLKHFNDEVHIVVYNTYSSERSLYAESQYTIFSFGNVSLEKLQGDHIVDVQIVKEHYEVTNHDLQWRYENAHMLDFVITEGDPEPKTDRDHTENPEEKDSEQLMDF